MNTSLTVLLPSLLLCAACTIVEQPRDEPLSAATLSEEQVNALAQALAEPPPPESDLPPMAAGAWSLACGAALELAPGGSLEIIEPQGLRPIGGQAVGEPALNDSHDRVAWAHAPGARPETVVSVVACEGGRWGEPRTLVQGPGSPDRVAISPDGAWVAWVSGASGVAALWAAPFTGGEPVQITSVGVDRKAASPGKPPAGFVAVPHQGPPVIEHADSGGYRVLWQAPDGVHRVELP